jgi:hypothetical protein
MSILRKKQPPHYSHSEMEKYDVFAERYFTSIVKVKNETSFMNRS